MNLHFANSHVVAVVVPNERLVPSGTTPPTAAAEKLIICVSSVV